ncbi:MAG: glycoside hydrolase family 27 protein [Solirubrobacterales bacterium]|nr:glycoside hydrolase family 27 protein [Solirubrobacterales bacterium]
MPGPPYMGVDTWYGFGSAINQATVVSLTDAVLARGLASAGYRYVWLDAGWWQGDRAPDGAIRVDPTQWPNGMAWMVQYIHSRGLLAGIYTDAGAGGCNSGGSLGHYQQDVNTFTSWGFDAVKVDYCGGNALRIDPRVAFSQFAQALAKADPHRPMLFALCNGAVPGEYPGHYPSYDKSAFASFSFAPQIATSWRTGPDIGVPGSVVFASVLRNLVLDAAHPRAAGGGHWNDPDYLVPEAGMSALEAQTQFTMWAMIAAPMMLSGPIMSYSPQTQKMVTNRRVIAISQDPLGLQGKQIGRTGMVQIWRKHLVGAENAVALLNPGARRQRVLLTPARAGLRGVQELQAVNVWTGRVIARRTRRLRLAVPAHGAVLLRLRAATSRPAGGVGLG